MCEGVIIHLIVPLIHHLSYYFQLYNNLINMFDLSYL